QKITLDAVAENKEFIDPKTKRKTSRTCVPARAITEALKCTVGYDDKTKKVTITNCLNKIELWINKPTALVNGNPIAIDDNPYVITYIQKGTGRTVLKLRFIAETLGSEVTWDQYSQTAAIKYNPPN
ncbi:MAG: copper amine oxidase N-terminal domain-containing protein, partial [Caldiserica bacterium]|nr:copper amine oxidase N-terminal domain-containing protein [Caldisericota bacterium]